MKQILFFALMAAAVLGCKRSPDDHNTTDESGDIIALSSGNVVISKADPVANEGEREAFVVGDQIGVFAAYPTSGGSGDPTPDWTEAEAALDVFAGTYFANRPAKCTTAGGPWVEDSGSSGTWVPGTVALFTWGADGAGGTSNIQTYPKQDKEVFIYAYYPYATNGGPAVDAAALTVGPKWAITLNTDRTKQADLLYAVGASKATQPAKTVKRTDPLAPLSFEHALAQVDFKLYKDENSTVANCKFLSLEFVCPSKGSMTLMDGKIAIETTGADVTETYTIKDARGEELADGKSAAISALGTTKLLMVFPMTTDELADNCTLKLKLYYGADPVEETDPTENVKEFTIALNATALKAIAQGKKNTIYLGVTTTEIVLEGTVAQWKDNPDSSDLVVE